MTTRYTRTAIAATQACLLSYMAANGIAEGAARRVMTDIELSVGRVLSIPDLPSPEVMQACLGERPDPRLHGFLAGFPHGVRVPPPHKSQPWPEELREEQQKAGFPNLVSPLPMSIPEWMAVLDRTWLHPTTTH